MSKHINRHQTSQALGILVTNFMKTLFERKKEDDLTYGLALLPAPTGSGKTHKIAEIMRERKKTQFIYAVNTIENSNDIYHKLLEFYSKDEGLYAFNREVLRLKSNKDTTLAFFNSIPIKSINTIFNTKYSRGYQNKEDEVEEDEVLSKLLEIQAKENNQALEYLANLTKEFKSEEISKKRKNELNVLSINIKEKLNLLIKRSFSLSRRNSYDDDYDFHKDNLEEVNRTCRREILKFYELLGKEKPYTQRFIFHASKLFPTLNIDEYRVVILTTSKLLLPIVTKDGSRHLYKSSDETSEQYGTQRLLILDEFDLQMRVLLSHILDDNTNILDKGQLFLTLHKRLDKHKFSPHYAIGGLEEEEAQKRKKKLNVLLSTLEQRKEKALSYLQDKDVGQEEYYYNFSFEVSEEDRNDTLKSDTKNYHLEHHIFKLYIHIDHKRKSYVVYRPTYEKGEMITSSLKSPKDKPYKEFTREVNSYLGFLAKGIAPQLISWRKRTLRMIYKANEARQLGVSSEKIKISKSQEEEFSLSATRDVLRDFGINQEDNALQYHFFIQKIRENANTNDMQNKLIMQQDESFYLKGLSLLNVKYPRYKKRGELNPLSSYLSDLNLETTPEGKLIDMLSFIPILGISATSTIPAASANFDIAFLNKCGVAVHLPTKEEVEEIRRLYIEDHQQDERKFIIDTVKPFFPNVASTELLVALNDSTLKSMSPEDKKRVYGSWMVGKEDSIIKLLNSYLGVEKEHEELFHGVFSKIVNRWLSKRVDEHQLNQALSYAYLYSCFLRNDKMKSFILFLPRGMEKEKRTWKRYFEDESESSLGLGELFELLTDTIYSKEYPSKGRKEGRGERPKWQEIVFGVVANNKKRSFKEIHNRLAEGKRAFVFSTYATLGAGANIDYKIEGIRKDFDAIFLAKPTYVYGSTEDNNGKMEHLYYLNKLYYNTFISNANKIALTKKAISLAPSTYHKDSSSYLKNGDMVNFIANRLSQAIGRPHRVNNKDDDLYIFVEENLLEYLAHFDTSLVPTLPSFYALINYAKEHQDKEVKAFNKKESPFSLVAKNSSKLNSTVKGLLKEFWDNNTKNIKIYDEYRKQLLKMPTKHKEIKSKYALYLDFLTKNAQYYYITEDDHGSYDYIGEEYVRGAIEVSEAKCGLCYVSQVPLLKEHFEENGYALSFNRRDHLPMPKSYNDYKGVLGEEIGEILFKEVGVELQKFYDEEQREKIEYVEFADFYVGENKEVLIDFKNFSEGTKWRTKTFELFAKAERKRVAIREGKGGNAGRLTLIVNIFKQEESNIKEDKVSDNGAIHYIPYLIDTTQDIPTINYQALREIKERIALVVEDTVETERPTFEAFKEKALEDEKVKAEYDRLKPFFKKRE